MKTSVLVIGFLAVVALAVGAYLVLSGAEYVVEIPERQVDAAVRERFPIERRKAGVLKTALSNPRLELDGGSERLHMELEIEVDLGLASVGLGRSEQGAATISSGLRYDPEAGRLLLDGARLEELRVTELPDEYRVPVEEVVNRALARHVDGLVVYELSSDSYQESLARLLLKDVKAGDGVLRVVLGVGS